MCEGLTLECVFGKCLCCFSVRGEELVFLRLRNVFIVLLFLATGRLTPVSCVKFQLSVFGGHSNGFSLWDKAEFGSQWLCQCISR